MEHKFFMGEAIKEADEGIKKGHGGPFGSVIVKDGKIIGHGHNMVLKNHDATCHGEVSAIRDASKNLKTHDLSGAVIYTTSEPCPMCLCACMWANIKKIYYGCTLADNERIGFRDVKFEKMLEGKRPKGYLQNVCKKECLELFERYNKTKKTIY